MIPCTLNVLIAAKDCNVYNPGAGVGGHCLPVYPYYLVAKAEELGYHSKVITAGRAVNDYMPLHVFELLVDSLNECERAVKNSMKKKQRGKDFNIRDHELLA